MAATSERLNDERGALSSSVRRLEEGSVIREIEEVLGVDAHFPASICYELLDRILDNLIGLKVNYGGCPRLESWLVAVKKLHSKLGEKEKRIRKEAIKEIRDQGNDGKKATEIFENNKRQASSFDPLRYPIPAFLMERKGLSEDEEYLSVCDKPDHSALQTLFFMALINSQSSNDFNYIAIVLRGSLIGPCPGYTAFVKNIDLVGDFYERLNLSEFISEHSADEYHRTSSFLKVLIKLEKLAKSYSAGAGISLPSELANQSVSLPRPEAHDDSDDYAAFDASRSETGTAELPEILEPDVKSTSEVASELPKKEMAGDLPRVNRRWEGRYHRRTPNDSTRLTPIERRQVARVLLKSVQSQDKQEADGAAAVLLMYCTGLQLGDLLVAKVGERGVFNAEGKYRRSLRLPTDAYEPPLTLADHFEAYQGCIELQLPEMLLPWMNERLDCGHETLLQCMGGDEQSVRKSVELVLERIRDSGRLRRIRSERITAALALELAIKYQDMTVVFFLSGRPNHEAPMLSYYIVHSVEELARRYFETVHALLELPADGLPSPGAAATYSGHYPTIQIINRFRDGVTEQYRLAIANKENIIKRHNAFTSYCLGMLLLCTGHRPTKDPFSSIKHFHLDKGVLLICDKATDQERAWRLVALPPMAVSQMRVYLDYLPKLAAHLQGEDHSSDLPQRIVRMVSGEADILPLFFFLSNRGRLKQISVSKSKLAKHWSLFWPLPVYFLRHIMATMLLRHTNRADYVQIQLGHMKGVDYPLGEKSTTSPLQMLSEIGSSLNNILEHLGWGVAEHKMRMPASGPARYGTEKLERIMLGPAVRLAASLKKEAQSGELVKKLIAEQPRSAKKMSQDELEELFQRVNSEAMEEGYSVKRCRKLLYRYIRRQRGGRELLRQMAFIEAEPEPSPFTAETLVRYEALTNLRVAFAEHLDRRGRNHSVPTEEERLVEIICSAALFGGIANLSRLQALCNALQTRSYRFLEYLFVDIPLGEGEQNDPVVRWFPDKTSSSLIEGYYKVRNAARSPITVPERSVQKFLAELGSHGERPLERLALHSKAGLILEAPGYVVACATGKNSAVSLRLSAWVRAVSDRSLISVERSESEVARLGWAPDLTGSVTSWSNEKSRTFLQQLKSMISNARNTPRSASAGVRSQQKKALTELLQKTSEEASDWPALPKLLASWAAHLCQHGTAFKADLAFATVEKYLMLVANRLCPVASDSPDFLSLEAEDFERLYLTVVEKEPKEGRFELARQLYAFHSFITAQYWLDDLDWSVVMAASGGSVAVAYADASYVTSAEYQRALQHILHDQSLPNIQRWQYAGLLVWGYRFGLRFGEAFRLHYQDIQREGAEIYLWVRSTLHGEVKTKSSTRLVGLLEQLSDSETQVVDKLLTSGKSDFLEDRLIALSRGSAGSRELISRSQVVQYLGRLLKAVTGDEDARFHNLRHGWVSRQVGNLAGVSVPGFSDESRNPEARQEPAHEGKVIYPLRSISVGVGHASEMTTLESYTHCLDLIAPKYYPKSSPESPPLSDFAIGYAEQVSPDTPRRRKARGKSSGRRALMPSPDIKTSKYSEVLLRHELWEPKPLKLSEVDRLLRRFSYEGQPLEEIALQLGADLITAQAIVKRATRVEILSGYRGYQLARRSKDPVARAAAASPPKEKLFKRETARLHERLDDLTTWLEGLPVGERQEFFAGVEVWLHSTSSDPMVSIVSDYETLDALLSMAGKLDASAEILVEPGNDVSLLRELQVPVNVTDKLPMKMRGGIAARVGVRLRSPNEIGVDRSLRRLLFLLATAGESLKSP